MVNSDWGFLGIPNRNRNSGSKNLEIPRHSQKFQVNNQKGLEFLGIPTQSANDFSWKAVNLKTCQKFLGIFRNF